jgi:hypothetical protein
MYPIHILPGWMQSISAIFPIRWGLEAMDAALAASGDLKFYTVRWGLSLLISLTFWLMTRWLEGKVHDQIRISGEFSSI